MNRAAVIVGASLAVVTASARGAAPITCGKTNTPELGAGSQTFNSVFGATRNPYDVTRTCGGSSGGAAVALACGMVPLADGSDTGGSLRNPAAFCNVVGFRPSPGRVPRDSNSWSPLSVAGPMARSVSDVALFLSAIAGPDPSSPLSIVEDGARFRAPLERDFKGVRVAWWKNLGGVPCEPEIRRADRRQPARIRGWCIGRPTRCSRGVPPPRARHSTHRTEDLGDPAARSSGPSRGRRVGFGAGLNDGGSLAGNDSQEASSTGSSGSTRGPFLGCFWTLLLSPALADR